MLQNVGSTAACHVTMKVDNVAGVKIPVFEKTTEEKKTVDLTGLPSHPFDQPSQYLRGCLYVATTGLRVPHRPHLYLLEISPYAWGPLVIPGGWVFLMSEVPM